MGAGEGWWRQGQPAAAPSGGSRASRRQAQVVPLCRRMTSLPLWRLLDGCQRLPCRSRWGGVAAEKIVHGWQAPTAPLAVR